MKKLLSLILAGSMLFSLAACGDEAKDKDEDKKNNTEAVENVDANNGDEADIGGGNGSVDLSEATVGDYITFGTYEQDNNTSNGKEPIEWLVLDEQDGKILVISKYALDCEKFNTIAQNVEWEHSVLRRWLDVFFIEGAFSDSEVEKISTVTVTADENPDYDTDPGNDTQDKVFLLSIDEANKYFDSSEARLCKATDSAVADGSYVIDEGEYAGTCRWWLRSPGSDQCSAAYVSDRGIIHNSGNSVDLSNVSVRPAMWIEL